MSDNGVHSNNQILDQCVVNCLVQILESLEFHPGNVHISQEKRERRDDSVAKKVRLKQAKISVLGNLL